MIRELQDQLKRAIDRHERGQEKSRAAQEAVQLTPVSSLDEQRSKRDNATSLEQKKVV